MRLPTFHIVELLEVKLPNMYAFLAGATSAALGSLALGFFAAFLGASVLDVALYGVTFIAAMSGGYKLYQRRATGTTIWLALACVLCGLVAAACAWLILDYSQGYRGLASASVLHLAGYVASGFMGSFFGAKLRLRYEDIT